MDEWINKSIETGSLDQWHIGKTALQNIEFGYMIWASFDCFLTNGMPNYRNVDVMICQINDTSYFKQMKCRAIGLSEKWADREWFPNDLNSKRGSDFVISYLWSCYKSWSRATKKQDIGTIFLIFKFLKHLEIYKQILVSI